MDGWMDGWMDEWMGWDGMGLDWVGVCVGWWESR